MYLAITKEIEQRQAVYSKPILWLHDLWILGLPNTFIWQCPTPSILKYNGLEPKQPGCLCRESYPL